MNPPSSSVTGRNRSSAMASSTRNGMCRPGSGPVLHSSKTETPSLNQRGTRLPVASRVKMWAISCHSVVPQWNSPSRLPDGLSMATR